jgi:hypothetical protein
MNKAVYNTVRHNARRAPVPTISFVLVASSGRSPELSFLSSVLIRIISRQLSSTCIIPEGFCREYGFYQA